MTHPEVAARVALATGLAERVKELAGAVRADEYLAAGAQAYLSRLEAAPLLLTKQCTRTRRWWGRCAQATSSSPSGCSVGGCWAPGRPRSPEPWRVSARMCAKGTSSSWSVTPARRGRRRGGLAGAPRTGAHRGVPATVGRPRPQRTCATRGLRCRPEQPCPEATAVLWLTVLLAVALLALVVLAVPALT